MIGVNDLIAKFRFALEEKWGYIWGTAGVLWTEAKQNQKVNYMVNKYGDGWKNSSSAKNDNYYLAAKEGGKWVGHTVADCSGLFAWAFRQLGGSIAHGSNSIWDRYCSRKGELISGTRDDKQELKAGTAVFTYNKTRKNRGHIGLYVGNGLVIEASGTIAGVCTSKVTNKKWVEWGELKDVRYDGAEPIQPTPEPPAPGDEKPTLRKGDRGSYVTLLQTELINRGYDLSKYGADGSFGNETLLAVKSFQKDNGLTVDGVVGKQTWAALDKGEPVKQKLYTVTIPHIERAEAEELLKKYPGTMKLEE